MSDNPKYDPSTSIPLYKGRTKPGIFSVLGGIQNPATRAEATASDEITIFAEMQREKQKSDYWENLAQKIRASLQKDFSALHKKIDDGELKQQERFNILSEALEEIKNRL